MRPYFTVITPVLNGKSHAKFYVQSLQNQTFVNWEAIVIDDGSTDGTIDILRKLSYGDSRFCIMANTLKREVPSPYQARNTGINKARGEFICFLDIDDTWLPHKLAEQKIQLEKNPRLCLIFSTYIRARQATSEGKIRNSSPLFGPKFWIHLANPIPMLTACVHRDAIKGLRFSPKNHEDYIYWHEVLRRLKPDQIGICHKPLAVYHIHEQSISSNKLQATYWIWECYRFLGYSLLMSTAALLGRGMLQAYMTVTEAMNQKQILKNYHK